MSCSIGQATSKTSKKGKKIFIFKQNKKNKIYVYMYSI